MLIKSCSKKKKRIKKKREETETVIYLLLRALFFFFYYFLFLLMLDFSFSVHQPISASCLPCCLMPSTHWPLISSPRSLDTCNSLAWSL